MKPAEVKQTEVHSMAKITVKHLLEAGVHFGHQTRRWNPKMKPYIFGERGGIYILNLQKTLRELDRSYTFVNRLAARGEKILFVGTKKQAQEPIEAQAKRSGMPYVNQRWLGGMLTNFVTMRERVSRMEELENMEADGRMATLPKKEQQLLKKELAKLQTNLNGVRDMRSLPGAIFVVDTKREDIAIREAHRLGIPVVGILDTNADPDEVEYGIPANDDAIRSVALMCQVIADAVVAATGTAASAADDEQLKAAEAAAAPAVVESSSADVVTDAEVAEEVAAVTEAPAAE